MAYTIEQLEKESCSSFGGNNCVLHQCMYGCVLQDAKKKAMKEKGMTDEEIAKKITTPKKH